MAMVEKLTQAIGWIFRYHYYIENENKAMANGIKKWALTTSWKRRMKTMAVVMFCSKHYSFQAKWIHGDTEAQRQTIRLHGGGRGGEASPPRCHEASRSGRNAHTRHLRWWLKGFQLGSERNLCVARHQWRVTSRWPRSRVTLGTRSLPVQWPTVPPERTITSWSKTRDSACGASQKDERTRLWKMRLGFETQDMVQKSAYIKRSFPDAAAAQKHQLLIIFAII